MHRNKQFAVIGLGHFGREVARKLTAMGHHVLGIDSDEHVVMRIADDIEETVIADARDEVALDQAGLASYAHVIIAISSNLEVSILTLMNLRNLGIEQITAKAADKRHARILEALGARDIIIPERQAAEHLAERLQNPAIRDYLEVSPNMHLALLLPMNDLLGESIDELQLGQDRRLELVALLRKERFLNSAEAVKLILVEGDKLLISGSEDAIRELVERWAD